MPTADLRLSVIPLRGLTVFPNMIISFAVGRQKSLNALEIAVENNEPVFLTAQRDAALSNPKEEDLCEIGTIVKIKQVLKLPGNLTHIIVEGITRGRLISLEQTEQCEFAMVAPISQDNEENLDNDTQALMRVAEKCFDEYTKNISKYTGNESVVNVISATKPGQMADVIASGMHIPQEMRQTLLEMLSPVLRLGKVIEILNHELEIMKLKKEIEEKVKQRIDSAQREYFLKEELKVIQEELGDRESFSAEIGTYRKKISKLKLPQESLEAISHEINRLEKMVPSAPDANVLRNYIEFVLSLPWGVYTKEKLDIVKAEKILDVDHYGLIKVKERIVEHLAVIKNAPDVNTPILCLVGPPGVGKTSIAKSVARAIGRRYIRMSLGGVKDESEIRGHRRTYIGAMAGRMIKSIKQAGTSNPLILLDEVDKLSSSYNGDPASALLEVLDAEQNYAFVDHYLEIPFDLSRVFFICTANSLDTIAQPLRDRMEIIELSSYTAEEKLHIIQNHLYPKQMEKHRLKKSQLKINPAALEQIISGYTREAGVRQLERLIGKLCRKTVKLIMSGEAKRVTVTATNVPEFLGKRIVRDNKIFEEPQVGIVRGLAWTQVGGDTLSIEVNTMKGTGKFQLTGNMGDVMKESAKAAVSYIRSQSANFGLKEDFYKEKDIHIHIPEGAVPKDGPSAGITMATAMISALTGAKIKNDVAMTGEITIRGRVLPIGGLKEKAIAAKKAGITTIIIPYENQRDMEEIPLEIKKGLDFILAKEMQTVLHHAVVEGEELWK